MEQIKMFSTMILACILLVSWVISMNAYDQSKKELRKTQPTTVVEWITVVFVPLGSIVYTFYSFSQFVISLFIGE
jgi:TRAP-type C4-dicarboxylate transport system permease small subunit